VPATVRNRRGRARCVPIGRATAGTNGHFRTARYTGSPADAQDDPLRTPTFLAAGHAARRSWVDEYDPAVGELWDSAAPGIVRLPSGRLVRGRALSRPPPDGPRPALGIYLLDHPPPAVPWESRWLRWPDFGLPADPSSVLSALTEAWQRAATERVEVACAGGHGRTGTALACLAILDGVPAAAAVTFVREHYDQHAVETPAQLRYVARWQNRMCH
jgi:hypothetical protein